MTSGLKPMDVDGREEAEAQLYLKGPLSVLTASVKTNSMVRSYLKLFDQKAMEARLARGTRQRRRFQVYHLSVVIALLSVLLYRRFLACVITYMTERRSGKLSTIVYSCRVTPQM
jgi:hypothetical protein